MADQNELLTLTADIVAAHVSNNTVAVNDVANLVQKVHEALTTIGQPQPEPRPVRREAKVSVRSSVKPAYIVCLIDGTKHKMLKRHLQTAHGLTPREYRDEFGLNADYPMVAPEYSETRRGLAKSIGLGTFKRKPAAGGDAPAKKPGGRPRAAKAE